MVKVRPSQRHKTRYHFNMKETRKVFPPYASLTFDEYWLEQDELWDISLKESKKQKDERQRKLSKKILQDENNGENEASDKNLRNPVKTDT